MTRLRKFQWTTLLILLPLTSCTCGVLPITDRLAGVNACGKKCVSDDECGGAYVCQVGRCAGDGCADNGTGSSSSGGTVGGPDGGTVGSSGGVSSDGGVSSGGVVSSGSGENASSSGTVASGSGSAGSSLASSGASTAESSSSASGGAVSGSSGVVSSGGSGAATSGTGTTSGATSGTAVSSSGGVALTSGVSGSSSGGAAGSSSGGIAGSSSGGAAGSSSGGVVGSSSGGVAGSSSGGAGGSSSSSAPCVGGYVNALGTCIPWTVCNAQQFESAPPSATVDRVCTALTVCSGTQFEAAPPAINGDRVCLPLTVCTAAEFELTAPTTTADRVCAALSVCTASQYQSAAPTATSDRMCSTITECTAAQYQTAAPTAVSDRVCRAITICNAYQYQTAPPTATTDRVCEYLTECDVTQYETTAPTATSDRVCTLLTVCGSGQCETVAPTATTDRSCGPMTLVLNPPGPQTITIDGPTAPATVVFQARACGNPVIAAWTVDVGALAGMTNALGPSSTLVPSGTLGGVVTVIAGFQGNTARAQVLVRLQLPAQNGATASEATQVPTGTGALVTGGGVGGVGGEGLGPPLAVASNNYIALQGSPTGNGSVQNLKMLYPYDATVWPRGMLAPLLQWEWSFGDADGVRIDLATTSGSFTWTGYFDRPAILALLPPANQKFIRHPIPQDIWEMATNTAGGPTLDGTQDRLGVKVTVARNGAAYGPLTQTWGVAAARLTGTIYYQSYGTNLADNYGGAQGTPSRFGAAVLSIRGGETGPQLVSSYGNCQVCHSVAARGGRLVVQAETNSNSDTWDYELTPSGVTSSKLTNGVPAPGYPALSADGAIMITPGGALQSLPSNASGNLPVSGLSAVSTSLGVPTFSPDGTRLAFNPQNGSGNNGRQLVVMNFNRATSAFSNKVVVEDNTVTFPSNSDVRPTWPAFFPDSNAVVYQRQLRTSSWDGNSGDAHTRKFAQGEIVFAPVAASATVVPMRQLNGRRADGTSYLPVRATASTLSCTADSKAVGSNANPVSDGDLTHANDANYNYEPTVNPVSSGGYAWVVFTSRRMYGNVATIPPFCSDPRGVDLHANMTNNTNITTKKLWVAAIDINPQPGSDGSHPAFYLPAQELLAGNARGFWVLDPCRVDNASCVTGDQCCNGYCQPNGLDGALVCSNRPPNATCSNLQEACASATDCCSPTALCINHFCAAVAP